MCPGSTDVYEYSNMSHRERASVHVVLGMIRKEQKKSDNIFESVLGIPLWNNMIHSALHRAIDAYGDLNFGTLLMNISDDNNYEFHIRGDASFVLMEMIQQSLITQLARAMFLVARRPEDDMNISNHSYPVLTQRTFFLQAVMQQGGMEFGVPYPSYYSRFAGSWDLLPKKPEVISLAATLFSDLPGLTKVQMEKIVRRIAARAGVVKLKYDMYEEIWASAIHTILIILIPICYQSVFCHLGHTYYDRDDESEMETNDSVNKPVLYSHERIRDVPPFPYHGPFSNNNDNVPPGNGRNRNNNTWHYVLVPKQLEDASRPLLVVDSQVYGDGWHVVNPSLTREQEIDQAMSMYKFVHHEFEWDLDDVNDMEDAAEYLDAMDDGDDSDEVSWTSDETEN